jgi:hypothetical protein
MSIYKPAPGETVYDPAFANGLNNIDSHTHSGAPNNGSQIGTSGIQDGAITPAKLGDEILSEVTGTTTNATPTEIVSIAIAESQAITVTGRFVGLLSTTTEAIGGNFVGTFLRPTASSVQSVSVPDVTILHNSLGNPSFQLVADTGAETISLRMVGEASKTINWHVVYNILQQPEV